MYYSSNNQGFVIVFAVLISALVLLIGVGIFRISIKETTLSSSARESTIAFFAADGGLECALRHANKETGFLFITEDQTMSCRGEEYGYRTELTGVTDPFIVEMPRGTNSALTSCAQIEVNTQYNGNNTQIKSRGFNVCVSRGQRIFPDTNNPILLERVLEIEYPNR